MCFALGISLWGIFPFLAGAAMQHSTQSSNDKKNNNLKTAIFAGGCFWCMEAPFEKLSGVLEVVSGYAGGEVPDPTYEQVCTGKTGHTEVVQVVYDPAKVSYESLLEVFWQQIDPTDGDGQFADRGTQYRTAIFYHEESQREAAENSKATLEASGKFNKPIVTQILPVSDFFAAEEYHQNYYQKNPLRYQLYRMHSGREDFLKKHWKED